VQQVLKAPLLLISPLQAPSDRPQHPHTHWKHQQVGCGDCVEGRRKGKGEDTQVLGKQFRMS